MKTNTNGLELADLLSIDTTTLRQRQADALKQHVIKKLEKIIDLVKIGHFDEIETETAFSGAGDGYGNDEISSKNVEVHSNCNFCHLASVSSG